MRNKSNSQAGFSLVAVLIVMGVVLFSILLISQARFRAQGTQKALKVKQSYGDVNQALINNVVAIFHKNIASSCNGLVASSEFQNVALDGNVKFSYKTSVPELTESPQVHKDAKKRCASPSNPGGSGNRFYFCTELTKDSSAPKDSILNAQYAFAEFAVELIDLQTQTAITCAEYASRRDDTSGGVHRDGSAGMAVTMALYWANQSGTKNYTFSQKALSYIANQN